MTDGFSPHAGGRCQGRHRHRETTMATPIYTQAREGSDHRRAEAAQLGPKLSVAPACTADRVRASLILCPAR